MYILILISGYLSCCVSEMGSVMYSKPCDRVVHLTLIAVRRCYRKCKIGEYLLSVRKLQYLVGLFS